MFFNKKNNSSKPESIKQARKKLDKIYNLTSMLNDNCIEITMSDVVYKKNEWITLPDEIAFKSRAMLLHEDEDHTSILIHYLPYGFTKPHLHKDSHESIEVLEGTIMDASTKTIYKAGEKLFIPKGEKHHVISVNDDEAYLYVRFSKNKQNMKSDKSEIKDWIKYKEIT